MTRNFSRFWVALLLCVASTHLMAAPPSKIEAHYDVLGFGMTLANITETFTRQDDNYKIESTTKAIGLLARFKPETVRVSSTGKIKDNSLIPINYSLTREVDTHKNASAKFNWEKSILTHTDYKGINHMPLPAGTQDRLSVLYHLPLQLHSKQSEFKFAITDGNNLENYIFTLSEEGQTVRVPLGSFKARHFTNEAKGEQIKYEIWLASEQDYFPYKIIVTDAKGGKLTQVLTDITVTP